MKKKLFTLKYIKQDTKIGHRFPLCGGSNKSESPPFIKSFFDHERSLLPFISLKSKQNKKLDIPLSFWTLFWLYMRPRTAVANLISSWECNKYNSDESRDKGITEKWNQNFWLHQSLRLFCLWTSSYLNKILLLF